MKSKSLLGRDIDKTSSVAAGIALEKIVTRIQQMVDPNSVVTHNEWLEDRVGNKRQYDIVIRGRFGGRPVVGVVECKDHSRKKGPDTIEAFAKKTENLGANLRLIVSRKGFTDQALKLARHENIGCLSLLPADPNQAGFSIGDMWYGVVKMWTNVRLMVRFAVAPPPVAIFESSSVKWDGKPVINWFLKELFTTYGEETKEGEHSLELKLDSPIDIEVNGEEHAILSVTCIACRVYRKKRKWVSWSGDAFYDWHSEQLTIPSSGIIVGSAIETDLSTWQDYEGEIPKAGKDCAPFFIRAVLYNTQRWNPCKDDDVPDLGSL